MVIWGKGIPKFKKGWKASCRSDYTLFGLFQILEVIRSPPSSTISFNSVCVTERSKKLSLTLEDGRGGAILVIPKVKVFFGVPEQKKS